MQALKAENKNAEEVEVGCSWHINSVEHNYSWFNYVKTLDEPVPDKEICQLLGITQAQLNEAFAGAAKKIRAAKNTPEVRDFIETVAELAASRRDDMYEYSSVMAESGETPIVAEEERTEEDALVDSLIDAPRKRKMKKGFGMPIHRDGKKVDIYGITSKKTMEKNKKDGK